MLMIGSNAGIVGMTKEHLGLSLALGVPVLVVITKIDMCPANVLENTVKQLTKILKSAGCRKIPMFVKVMSIGNRMNGFCWAFNTAVESEGKDINRVFLSFI